MKAERYKTLAIIILAIVVCIESFFLFRNDPPVYDETLYTELKDSLKRQHDRDVRISNLHLASAIEHKRKYDSLMQLPAKIEIKYVPVYKKINSAGANALIASSDTIFANNGVK